MAARKNTVPLDPSTVPLPTSTGFMRSVIERRRIARKKKLKQTSGG